MTDKSILYKNTHISFSDTGKGSALVFLHGFLENRLMWKDSIDSFSSKYRVIAIDLLGHGSSGCTGYIHNMEDMADVVHAVLGELKIRKATLVGHSMGGYVALAFAELYPDQVRSLALVNSTSRSDSEERKINRDRAIEIVKKNSESFVKMAISNLFSSDAKIQYATAVDQAIQQALKTSKQGIVAALEGMKIRPDREVILHFAPYPIALILGRTDTVVSYADSLEQLEGNQVKLISLSGGHMAYIENKRELLETLAQFFKSK